MAVAVAVEALEPAALDMIRRIHQLSVLARKDAPLILMLIERLHLNRSWVLELGGK